MKSNIAKKLIVNTILFSSAITLVITAMQLYTEFKYEVKGINEKLEQIKVSYKKSITQSLWISDRNQLQIILNGITELPDIIYSKVQSDSDVDIVSGAMSNGETIEYKMDLHYLYNNRNIYIGSFTVSASLTDVYNRLLNRLWIILLSNALKTSLVALFIYIIFFKLVTRHLTKISTFSEEHDPLSSTPPLSLDRNNDKHDEFDSVVQSINDMHTRLNMLVTEMNEQKLYLSLTLNSIGDAVITTDNDGFVTQLNPVAEQLTGWKSDDALQQPLDNIISIVNTATRAPVVSPIETVLNLGKSIQISGHNTLISKDGAEYQIAESVSLIRNNNEKLGMVLVFKDVTEQQKMREALHDSEKKLRLIHSQVPGIVYQLKVDINGNKSLLYASPAIENYIGLTAETVMDDIDKWFNLIHPDDYPGFESSIKSSLTNLSLWEWQGRFILLNGDTIWLHGISTPERLDDGSTIWNGVFTDITTRVQADEIIDRSQKMDALGKLTGGIAHDYNNMLGVILGYSEILKNSLSDRPKLQNHVDKIKRSAVRGAKLTKKLLAFSANKSSDSKKANINTLLTNTHNILEKTLTARIKLLFKLDQELWPVLVDESDLEDTILNMTINAMHAIDRNGEFTIETKNISLNMIESKALDLVAGDYIQLRFTDTGCGMDNATKEKIFDPFYSTKGDHGTGLGLSQVYGFITRCQGVIQVRSAPHKGTTFTLYFPRYFGNKDSPEKKEDLEFFDLEGNETILVVDDEVDLLNLTCEILSQYGYHVFSAESAIDALKIIESEHIDLILSDIIMPDMDGYALSSKVQKDHPDIKIQLASGYSSNHNINKINLTLSENILVKPYSAHELLIKIRALLDQ